MASNTFGNVFKITTWGESHGQAVGVVIDGCPAGISLNEADINEALLARSPGRNSFVSQRKESDCVQILSGVFEGLTTGTPLSILIPNRDADSSKYEPIKNLYRPGHANFTYLKKYGVFDHRGGGRASARETACRVAAGAVATKLLALFGIGCVAHMSNIAGIQVEKLGMDFLKLQMLTDKSPIFCPDAKTEKEMMFAIQRARQAGDSLAGLVEFVVYGLPVGLGDPVYEKIDANLARAMMSIPAAKGFEIGEGFSVIHYTGSTHNDLFIADEKLPTATNHSGGLLGGITTGMPLRGRVAFKPTSSIMKKQHTVDVTGKKQLFKLPEGSRHDPCLAIRAVPVVKAMCALVLADSLLMNTAATAKSIQRLSKAEEAADA